MLPIPRGGRGTTLKGDRWEHGAEEAGSQGGEELTVCSDSSGNASTLSHYYAGKYAAGKQKYSGKYSARRFLKPWMKAKYVQSYVSRYTSTLKILAHCLLFRCLGCHCTSKCQADPWEKSQEKLSSQCEKPTWKKEKSSSFLNASKLE